MNRLAVHLQQPACCRQGWEKGQVENQVGLARRRFFTLQLKVKNFRELNSILKERCVAWAKTHRHPTRSEKSVWEVYQEEKPYLMNLPPPFDGYAERPARVTPTSLVSFDRNRYSVDCSQVGRTVQLRVYAERIVIVKNGEVVGDHEREFGRGKTVFDSWHYLPALERKPGALRNGAPFRDWALPQSITELLGRLKEFYTDWDRQFVAILNAVPLYGLEPVDKACRQALDVRVTSKEVVLNFLNRDQDQDHPPDIAPPSRLILKQEPVADCRRYDRLLREAHHVTQ